MLGVRSRRCVDVRQDSWTMAMRPFAIAQELALYAAKALLSA
jgi:hypothetical protein